MRITERVTRRQSAHVLRPKPAMKVANDLAAFGAAIEARWTLRHSSSPSSPRAAWQSEHRTDCIASGVGDLPAPSSHRAALVLHRSGCSCFHIVNRELQAEANQIASRAHVFGRHIARVTPEEQNRNMAGCGFGEKAKRYCPLSTQSGH